MNFVVGCKGPDDPAQRKATKATQMPSMDAPYLLTGMFDRLHANWKRAP